MVIAEVPYLRDDDFLYSRNTMHKKHTMYKKSFVVIGGYYPPVCAIFLTGIHHLFFPGPEKSQQ